MWGNNISAVFHMSYPLFSILHDFVYISECCHYVMQQQNRVSATLSEKFLGHVWLLENYLHSL